MSRRAAELLALAYKKDPSIYERRNWIWRFLNRSRIQHASELKAEAKGLLAIADPDSIEPLLRSQLRSAELRSYAMSLDTPGKNRADIVETLAQKRISLLHAMNACPSEAASDLAGGRLLFYEPEDNFNDGASQYASKGFFDEKDAPPWDTWVCYFERHLVSWVPSPLLGLVQAGIAANPVDCVRLIEEVVWA